MGPSSGSERFYVIGSSGALGAWVVKQLLDSDVEVVVDSPDDRSLRLIARPDQLGEVHIAADPAAAMAGVTHVIHTSSLTDERCVADPVGCAASAIGGFADTIRAAVEEGVRCMAFQSSMSVFAPSAVRISSSSNPSPTSLAGTFHLGHLHQVGQPRHLRRLGR